MNFQTIEGCCSAVTMSENPDFSRFTNRYSLRSTIIAEMVKQGFHLTNGIWGIIFITNDRPNFFTRLYWRWFLGISFAPSNYKYFQGGLAAHVGIITLRDSIHKTWRSHVDIAYWEEVEKSKKKLILPQTQQPDETIEETVTEVPQETANV